MAGFYLTTLGCRLNEAENASWARELRRRGHHLLDDPEGAQILVLNTCAVTSEAARKSRQLARRLHRTNPTAKLVITGCYAELEADKVQGIEGVDLVVGNREKSSLVQRILSALELESMPEMALEPDAVHVYSQRRTRAFVKIQDGCRNKCSYCIVTVARGAERSRTEAEVIDELKALEASGHKEAVLTGVHLGGYGHDIDTDLMSLVRRILDETSLPRIRLSSIEPWTISDDFWTLWADPRLCPHLHLPLQSGSNAVLKRMSRRCTVETFKATVERLRAKVPDLMVTTDLIVGFPGESEEEFRESLGFLREMQFSHAHIFAFSAREGTRAAGMHEQLTRVSKRERSQLAHRVAAASKVAVLKRAVGQTRPVLWEAPGRPVDNEEGVVAWLGYSDNYLRVQTLTTDGIDLENVITQTTLTELADGESLLGFIDE